MTISSDEFENNIMADAEEFSPAIQQQDNGTHKVSFSVSSIFEYFYSFYMKNNTETYLFQYNNTLSGILINGIWGR